MCIVKFWFKILNSDVHKLIYIVNLLQQPHMGEWLSHVKNILCINGFGKVWIDQGVDNQRQFLNAFEKRCQDILVKYVIAVGVECTKKLSYYFLHHVRLNLKFIKI